MTHPLISAAELASLLGDPNLVVFDVRHNLTDHAAGAVAHRAGHVPGAHFLDHETELAAARTGTNGRHPLPDRQTFSALIARQGVGPQSRVVAYDASGGMFAAHLWWMLRWIGHDNVQVLDGGWQAWQAGGHPVSTDSATLSASASDAPSVKAVPDALVGAVSADDVQANIASGQFTVLDARAANRFRGEVEPMDPVAGHIPGALNRPNTDNLDEQGFFKPAESLRNEFKVLLGDRAPESIVHQCGSGITACHNLLAMSVAGLDGSRLYPGSWSEWCSDPARPVATGPA